MSSPAKLYVAGLRARFKRQMCCLYMLHADNLVGQAIKIEYGQNKVFVMLIGCWLASVAAAGGDQQS